ncbi:MULTISPECIES: DNA replication/repair protein RecF [unclassified Thioalkalivibrio]|uniref:DNA replication/repair protein RecF n=1 Tax=unclassified Thioalkalivibrio TaxID=2621013 RepID=UPI0009D97D8B|nr:MULTISPECIES: DNA replication and repair protein RecF [unclassified Thioalkalivibrio]
MLEALWWRGVRNLSEQTFEPGKGINRLVGPNGAGKTSVLEACHVLAAGRSFRTPQLRRVVRSGEKGLWIGGRVRDLHGGEHRLGVSWEGTRRSRLDGRWMEGHASVAEWLPVRVLHAGSFDLLTGSPEERRRLLDWGCFHSVRGYRWHWQQWRRAHEQRNAALRKGDRRAAREFERPLVDAGENITQARQAYIDRWEINTSEAARVFGFSQRLGDFQVHLRVGWDRDRSLSEAIARSRDSDEERGFGQVGPQRADIDLRFDGRVAAEASRGEQKRLITALTGGQARMLEREAGRAPVVLLDDVVSELDVAAVEGLMSGLLEFGWQVLVTTVEPHIPGLEGGRTTRLFHVEHGVVTPD